MNRIQDICCKHHFLISDALYGDFEDLETGEKHVANEAEKDDKSDDDSSEKGKDDYGQDLDQEGRIC